MSNSIQASTGAGHINRPARWLLWATSALVLVGLMPTAGFADDTEGPSTAELESRIHELEDIVFDLSDQVGSRPVINAFDARSLDIGGFLHNAYTFVDADQGSEGSFNRQTFELLVRAEFGDDWSAFMAQAFIRDAEPDVSVTPDGRSAVSFNHGSGSPLVIAWANKAFSDALNIKFGRFITPHGIINIEHFPASLLDTEQPQFLRPFRNDTIFPNFLNGIMAEGRLFNPVGAANYAVYTGNFVGNSEELVSGARIAQNLGRTGLELGLNASRGQRRDRTEPAFNQGNTTPVREFAQDNGGDYTVLGADLRYESRHFNLKSEYFTTDEDNARDREAYYVQPEWRISPQWITFYRYDVLDRGDGFGDEVENMVGVNYMPLSNIRLRTTLTNRSFRSGGGRASSEVDLVQVSGTLSF